MEKEKTVQTSTSSQPESDIQGEGDYEATRRHRDAAEKFVESHDSGSDARAMRPPVAIGQ